MTADWRDAINQALRLQQYPELAETFRRSPLPEGMSALIRIVSDQGGGSKDLAASLNINEASLKLAASDYLQVICFYSGSSDLRVLGLNAGATFKLAKEHHRLLLKWLHPDRNIDNKAFAERVNQAWSAFKSNSAEVMPANRLTDAVATDLPVGKPTSGRFPFFLTGLVAGVVFLLLLSILPDSDIYVGESDSSVTHNDEMASEQSVQANLQSLKSSLQTVVATVLLDNASATKASVAMANKTTQAKIKDTQPTTLASKKPSKDPVADTPSNTAMQAGNTADQRVIEQAASGSKHTQPVNVFLGTASTQQITQNKEAMFAAQVLVQNFQRYYQQGDSKLFMQLFSSDARNNRGGRAELEQDYSTLFAGSVQRKISFTDIRWQQSNAMLSFDARYSASVKRPGDLFSSTYKGRIKLIFVAQNEHILIQQVLLDK